MAAQSKVMTKADILAHFADKFDMSKASVGGFFDEIVALAAKEVNDAGSFTIPGLGKLTLSYRQARKGRNPATGQEIDIAAKTIVKMKLGKTCQDAIVK